MHKIIYDIIQQIGYKQAGGFFSSFLIFFLLSLILVPILQLIYQVYISNDLKTNNPLWISYYKMCKLVSF